MAGRLLSIGSVTVDYRRPNLKWSSTPGAKGIRECSISGLIPLNSALTLGELVANDALFKTIGGVAGVLAWVAFDGDVLLSYTGYYLLQSFEHNVERELMFGGPTGFTGFTLSAAFIGPVA